MSDDKQACEHKPVCRPLRIGEFKWQRDTTTDTLGGMQHDAATLPVSQNIKHAHTRLLNNHLPQYLPKGVGNLCPHKNLHMDVDRSITNNDQKLEVTKMPLSRWSIQTRGYSVQFSSVQSLSRVRDSLWPHELQHARPPCPSPTPRVHSNSCPSSRWCHPAISSSVIPFSSCPQSLPASESFPMS